VLVVITILRNSVLLAAVALFAGGSQTSVFASEDPVPPPPDVQTVTVNKDVPGGNVVTNWTDGIASFSVQRSESPNFLAPTNLTYVTRGTLGGPVSDPVLNDGKSYYYLVTDSNASAQVYSITNAAGIGFYQGETLSIDGTGFDPSCANDTVHFDGGDQATLLSCSSTQIQAEIPARAVSGSVIVVSPNGVSTRQTKLFALGLRTNTVRQAQTHINVDANHNLFACDETLSFNRIWRIDGTTGASSECANIGNPIGLPRSGSKLYAGTESISPNNVGSVRELDVSCSPLVNWGTTGTATTDPVYARAMALDPSGNNPGYVFLLDHAGDRIRRRQNGANLDTMWLTNLGLGGTSAGASDPAGFTFNNAGQFFFTASPSKIEQYSAAKALVQEFTSADGLSRPAQVVFDEAQTLWVANRDANNVLRIRTDPMNKLVRQKISGVTAPRGLAFDRDPVTNNAVMYVADQTEVYRFRVYDSVHLNVKVLNEALVSPSGVRTSQADFQARVVRDANFAADAFKQCGIEVVLDGVTFIADPNAAANGGDGSVLRDGATALTTEENILLGTSRSPNSFAVNLYYVHHFAEPNPLPPPMQRTAVLNGFTYTNDYFTGIPNNRTGIIVARFTAPFGMPGGALVGGAIDSTDGHELGHFLLDQFANTVGPGEHWGPQVGQPGCTPAQDPMGYRFNLMRGSGCATRWTITPAECTNILTNLDESAYVEQF
jgi:hypothetical protein